MSTVAIANRRSARLAAKPAVSYSEEDETPQMLAKKFKLDRYKVGPAPSPPRRSARLAAKPAVDYTDDDDSIYVEPNTPAPAPAGSLASLAVAITARIKEKRVKEEEKKRHVTFIAQQLALVDSLKGNPTGRAAVSASLMNYLASHCLNFLAAHPHFRDTTVAKCYEFKKYEPGYTQLIAACDRLLISLGLPTAVPAVLPVAPSKGSCGECSRCVDEADKKRAELEKRYAAVAAKEKAALEADKAAAGKTIRATITKLSQKVDKAGDATWETIAQELLRYAYRSANMDWLKANQADMMWVRGLIRGYSRIAEDFDFYEACTEFLEETW